MNLMTVLRGKEKLTGRHVVLFGIILLFFLIFTGWSVAYTSQSQFCGTCHEMEPMYQTWQTSTHRNVDCEDCHTKPGVSGVVNAKAKGLKELYLHVTSSNIAPKADERDVNCYNCHQDKVKLNTGKALAAKEPHTVKHFDNGMNCITCHSGVVHNSKMNNTVPGRDTCARCHLDTMQK
ncbi:cytochrome c3 family protein [Sporomusa aerivorans]|uniref:cytochrome c3 family protein n=1 Tax=Sporomusa aerivorans TaxID=204936 RepID=UPI00352AD535